MSKAFPSLFATDTNALPIVYAAAMMPTRESKPSLTFRYDRGEIGLSKALIELLTAEENRRVTFVNYKGSAYITRVDHQGYWIELRTRESSGVCSGVINAKRFTRDAVRALGHGTGDVLSFPVAIFQVRASEIGLDPAEYPYPFYRIVADQKQLKQ